jgi:hypothetical protein
MMCEHLDFNNRKDCFEKAEFACLCCNAGVFIRGVIYLHEGMKAIGKILKLLAVGVFIVGTAFTGLIVLYWIDVNKFLNE